MLKEGHKNEFLKSCINEDIIALNFKSLQQNAYEYLLYNLDNSYRRNDGRLNSNILKRYHHLDHGGWWASGIDLKTLKPSDWGCFKPDKPYISQGKPIKYEHPRNAPTSIFAFDVSESLFSELTGQDVNEIKGLNFWQWVIENPVDITITEGAKKAACLMSNGQIAIGLPGIWNGVKDGVLIEELQILSQVPRLWNIAFDEDAKWLTRNDVFRATRKLSEALINWEESAEVFVVKWDTKDGKGIDDVVSKKPEKLEELYESKLDLETYLEKFGSAKKLKRPQLLQFVLRNIGKRLEFNELKGCIELDGEPLEINEALPFEFIEKFNIDVYIGSLAGVLLACAKKNSYHPVQRYLENCAKLEAIRIDNLSSRYFGTTDELYDFFVQQWLIGAVARAFSPGCKMDFALLLQSRSKGIGKSTFFDVLGGNWYSDSLPDEVRTNKDYLSLHSAWIHEWAEFDRVTNKSAANKLKSFVTCKEDEFVEPYGRVSKPHPRRSVLCGTVNEDEFLRDPDGDRRFLILPIAPHINLIDNIKLKEERDRIWAGAVQAYLAGKAQGKDAWAIPREIEQKIIELSKGYSVTDESEYPIAEYLEDKERVSIAQIMEQVFNIPIEPGRENRSVQMTVSKILLKLEWQKVGVRLDGRNKRCQCWERIPKPDPKPDNNPPDPEGCDEQQKGCDQGCDQPQNQVISSNSENIEKSQPKGCDEVVTEVVTSEKPHCEQVSETGSQPHTEKVEKNFFIFSDTQKTVESDLENNDLDDEELQIGDRVILPHVQKTGRITWLNLKKTECQIQFDDGSSSEKAIFTYCVKRFTG